MAAWVGRLLRMSAQPEDIQRRMWTIGDYPTIARYLAPISTETVAALGLGPGVRVLDVGVGTGNAAIEAVRRGAIVTGIDLTPAQIDRARARCAKEGVKIELRVGNAEHLDVPDGSFDVVLSVMGMIFSPNPARATSEMARACRPGGTVALTAWAVGGWSEAWRNRVAHLIPAPLPGTPTPDEWGDPVKAAQRLLAAGLRPTVELHPFFWRFPSVATARDVFVSAAGPFVAFMEAASARDRGQEALDHLTAAIDESNQADDGTCTLSAPYLLAVGRR